MQVRLEVLRLLSLQCNLIVSRELFTDAFVALQQMHEAASSV